MQAPPLSETAETSEGSVAFAEEEVSENTHHDENGMRLNSGSSTDGHASAGKRARPTSVSSLDVKVDNGHTMTTPPKPKSVNNGNDFDINKMSQDEILQALYAAEQANGKSAAGSKPTKDSASASGGSKSSTGSSNPFTGQEAYPEHLRAMMQDGVPIKQWIILLMLLGVGLFQLRKILMHDALANTSKKKKLKSTQNQGAGTRGIGKSKKKKAPSAGHNNRSVTLPSEEKSPIEAELEKAVPSESAKQNSSNNGSSRKKKSNSAGNKKKKNKKSAVAITNGTKKPKQGSSGKPDTPDSISTDGSSSTNAEVQSPGSLDEDVGTLNKLLPGASSSAAPGNEQQPPVQSLAMGTAPSLVSNPTSMDDVVSAHNEADDGGWQTVGSRAGGAGGKNGRKKGAKKSSSVARTKKVGATGPNPRDSQSEQGGAQTQDVALVSTVSPGPSQPPPSPEDEQEFPSAPESIPPSPEDELEVPVDSEKPAMTEDKISVAESSEANDVVSAGDASERETEEPKVEESEVVEEEECNTLDKRTGETIVAAAAVAAEDEVAVENGSSHDECVGKECSEPVALPENDSKSEEMEESTVSEAVVKGCSNATKEGTESSVATTEPPAENGDIDDSCAESDRAEPVDAPDKSSKPAESEEKTIAEADNASSSPEESPPVADTGADEALAMKLQEEEEKLARWEKEQQERLLHAEAIRGGHAGADDGDWEEVPKKRKNKAVAASNPPAATETKR